MSVETATKPGRPARPESIPVRQMTFKAPHNIPGKNSASAVTAGDQSNRERWELTFVPHLRHFQIVYYRPGVPQSAVKMVHESHVADWEPL